MFWHKASQFCFSETVWKLSEEVKQFWELKGSTTIILALPKTSFQVWQSIPNPNFFYFSICVFALPTGNN